MALYYTTHFDPIERDCVFLCFLLLLLTLPNFLIQSCPPLLISYLHSSLCVPSALFSNIILPSKLPHLHTFHPQYQPLVNSFFPPTIPSLPPLTLSDSTHMHSPTLRHIVHTRAPTPRGHFRRNTHMHALLRLACSVVM